MKIYRVMLQIGYWTDRGGFEKDSNKNNNDGSNTKTGPEKKRHFVITSIDVRLMFLRDEIYLPVTYK